MELGRWEDLVMPVMGMPSGGVTVAVSHADDADADDGGGGGDCMLAAAEEEPAKEAVEADKQQEMDKTVTGSEIERTVPEDG